MISLSELRTRDSERSFKELTGNSWGVDRAGRDRAIGLAAGGVALASVGLSSSPATSDCRAARRAVFWLIVATACWGVSFPLIKAQGMLSARLLPGGEGWFFTAMTVAPRFGLAAVVLLVVRPGLLRGLTRMEWKQGFGLGGFAGLGMLLQNDGLHYTEASTSAFLTQLCAVMIPLWLAWRTRRNPGVVTWLAVGLVLAGVAVLGRLDVNRLGLGRGEIETLLGSIFFTGQILWLERQEFGRNRVFAVTLIMFVVEACIGFGLAGMSGGSFAAAGLLMSSGAWWTITMALMVICTLGAFLLMNFFQPRITSTEAGLIYCAEPIFGSVMALFMPLGLSALAGISYANERATPTLLLGGGLITLANVLIQCRPPGQPTLAPSVVTAETADAD